VLTEEVFFAVVKKIDGRQGDSCNNCYYATINFMIFNELNAWFSSGFAGSSQPTSRDPVESSGKTYRSDERV
jgi:hypothetical protein